VAERPLYAVSRAHLTAITGPLGIWQHAVGPVPDHAFGYCTDDVARALLVDLAHAPELGWGAVEESAWRSLRFLGAAFDPAERRFRNFRGADKGWSRSDPSEDSQGRALLALGDALGQEFDPHLRDRARDLFAAALPGTRRLRALRAIASSSLGCVAALDSGALDDVLHAETEVALARLAALLRKAFAAARDHGPDWPWPEPVLTYESALLPRALIVAGHRLGDAGLERRGLEVLQWLIAVQAADDGGFSPIGNNGWWRWGGSRAHFDQQPIEATSMILACEAALAVSPLPRYREAAERAYGWFLGDNDVGAPVAIPGSGACQDGLEPHGVNRNQGAESTLMWLLALEHMRTLRRRATAMPPAASRDRVLAMPAGKG
jgi:hypothetical protein